MCSERDEINRQIAQLQVKTADLESTRHDLVASLIGQIARKTQTRELAHGQQSACSNGAEHHDGDEDEDEEEEEDEDACINFDGEMEQEQRSCEQRSELVVSQRLARSAAAACGGEELDEAAHTSAAAAQQQPVVHDGEGGMVRRMARAFEGREVKSTDGLIGASARGSLSSSFKDDTPPPPHGVPVTSPPTSSQSPVTPSGTCHGVPVTQVLSCCCSCSCSCCCCCCCCCCLIT